MPLSFVETLKAPARPSESKISPVFENKRHFFEEHPLRISAPFSNLCCGKVFVHLVGNLGRLSRGCSCRCCARFAALADALSNAPPAMPSALARLLNAELERDEHALTSGAVTVAALASLPPSPFFFGTSRGTLHEFRGVPVSNPRGGHATCPCLRSLAIAEVSPCPTRTPRACPQ